MTWVGCEEAAALTIVGPSQPPQPQPQPLSLSNPTQGTLLHMHSCHSGTSFCRLGTRYRMHEPTEGGFRCFSAPGKILLGRSLSFPRGAVDEVVVVKLVIGLPLLSCWPPLSFQAPRFIAVLVETCTF